MSDIFDDRTPEQRDADMGLAIQAAKDEKVREHNWRLVTGVFRTAFDPAYCGCGKPESLHQYRLELDADPGCRLLFNPERRAALAKVRIADEQRITAALTAQLLEISERRA